MKSVTDNDGTSLASAGEGTTDDSGPNNKATDPTTNVTAVNDGADDRAATTIQAVYRGFRARKYVETVNAAAVKIQAGFRGYRVRRSLKNSDPPTIELSAPTDADENNDWSDDDDDDDDEKSVVSVTYAPLKERDQQQQVTVSGDGDRDPSQTADGETIESKGSDAKNPIPSDPEGRSETEEKKVEDGDDVEEDAEALTNAAVKIQAMVRGQAARKRLNDENNTEKQ